HRRRLPPGCGTTATERRGQERGCRVETRCDGRAGCDECRSMMDYLRDGGAIYRQWFAIIRAEADLSRFSDAEADVAVRMLHACGIVEIAQNIIFAAGVGTSARAALRAAAALELWRDRLEGALVVIGNAPTSLFRLLEMLDEGAPSPAAILGMPVGFV